MKDSNQARLKFAKEHLDDPEEALKKMMWSDETKIELFGINSTRMEVETFCFGGVSPLKGQHNFTVSRGG